MGQLASGVKELAVVTCVWATAEWVCVGSTEVERAQQAQRAATARSSKAEEQLSQARQAESTAHQRQIHVEHTLGEQVWSLHLSSALLSNVAHAVSLQYPTR